MTKSRQKGQEIPAANGPPSSPVPAPERPVLSGLDYFHLAQQISDENVWHWDLTRGSLHWSPQIASLLGIRKSISVLSGDPFQTFLHPEDLDRATTAISVHLRKGSPYRLEERLLTNDGVYTWFLVRGKAVRNAEGKPIHMTGYLTDIHSLKQEAVERELELVETRDFAKEMAVLNELSLKLTTHLSVEEVVQETYKQASRLLDTRNFAMSLYNPERGEHEFVLNITESAVDKETLTRQPANLGISGYIIHNRMPVLIKENSVKWTASLGVQAVGDRAQSWLGVPLLLDNQVLGVIIVQNYHQERVYDEHDRDLLMTIANSAAVALQNARLYSAIKQAELESTLRMEQINALLLPMSASLVKISRLSVQESSSDQAHSVLQEIAALASSLVSNHVGIQQLTHIPPAHK
jgi:PAS domain S-box-containing protein